ncbi:hypothetical protein ACHQM5_010780 [Ranunculus cassubicifolius]
MIHLLQQNLDASSIFSAEIFSKETATLQLNMSAVVSLQSLRSPQPGSDLENENLFSLSHSVIIKGTCDGI